MFVIMIIHQSLLEPFPRWDGGLCWCFVFRCLFSFVWLPWFVWWHWFCFVFSWLVGFAFMLPASVLIRVTYMWRCFFFLCVLVGCVWLCLFVFWSLSMVVLACVLVSLGMVDNQVVNWSTCPLAWLCLHVLWSPCSLAWLTTML